MLENPIFVHWCDTCGFEVEQGSGDDDDCMADVHSDGRPCPQCPGIVRRHQRVLEIPDEDVGALSVDSLKAALADIQCGRDSGSSARLLADLGPDPHAATANPALVTELVALGVPRALQRALVDRGFERLDQVATAACSAVADGALVSAAAWMSPAAEILLLRLRDVANSQEPTLRKRRPSSSALTTGPSNQGGPPADDSDAEDPWRLHLEAAKRLRGAPARGDHFSHGSSADDSGTEADMSPA